MGKPIIGILTWREGTKFEEPTYLRRLIREGRELGATVFLFGHQDIFAAERKIRGFVPSPEGGWVSRIYNWPEIVIDRCRKGSPEYREIRNSTLFRYVNQKYTNKWNATRRFMQNEAMRRWIPETVIYSTENLRQMLKKHELIYVKPGNGTGGRSILKISHQKNTKGGYTVLGRSRTLVKKRLTFQTLQGLTRWLNRWVKAEKIRDGHFMIQQGLNLELIPGRVADTRLLIQKNELGEWRITGLGVRVGGKNSPTSNLHGGGKAVSFANFLSERFNQEQIQEIQRECHQLAHTVVNVIEEEFGTMMEFGLDIGIDIKGRVWLIEVNPKPGRDIFKKMGNMGLYKKSVQRPLQFAMYLLEQDAG
ncbi:YheC/YheD family endospore coat-associated protein [Brevibacillus dissolubilis]|uniref:YheC/YheD family endospore coat-associated protein n=1 Tax=Brevibacillus dissolubilis TaxID=1844116 RepID=UPI001115EC0B|nr:YheC/YheD family protein [Brevibacillus dissolubilis]